MKLYKKLLVVALAAMPAAALQAQTYNDSVRTKTWTVYVNGGISGTNGLRGTEGAGVRTNIAPNIAAGVKYNIKPWVRVGATLGYTQIISNNTGIIKSTTTTEGYTVGNYNDGVLTVEKCIMGAKHNQHLMGIDLNADFNILEMWQNRDQRWNLWLGTGVGYIHGWDRSTITTAINEEAVSQGDDHFNVYNHSYVTTNANDGGTNTLYIPARLSLEYDITPNWTVGVNGEYKFLPLDRVLTPKGIWSAGVSVAYNFVRKPKHVCNDNHEMIEGLNRTIYQLRNECNDYSNANKSLENELQQSKAEVENLKGRLSKTEAQLIETMVYFDWDKAVVKDSELEKIDAVAKQLQKHPDLKAVVSGWASVEGGNKHNVKLSEKRANAIADIIHSKYGISVDRINVKASGPTISHHSTLPPNRVVSIKIAK